MNTAKIFTNGRSQAVRLPRDFRFLGKEVFINKVDGVIMLLPKGNHWAGLLNSLNKFSGDFMNERNQPEKQGRELL